MKKEIDGFTIGGCAGHPSLPGPKLQRLIGSTIKMDIENHVLYVPTPDGVVTAKQGDRVSLLDDGTLEVHKKV